MNVLNLRKLATTPNGPVVIKQILDDGRERRLCLCENDQVAEELLAGLDVPEELLAEAEHALLHLQALGGVVKTEARLARAIARAKGLPRPDVETNGG